MHRQALASMFFQLIANQSNILHPEKGFEAGANKMLLFVNHLSPLTFSAKRQSTPSLCDIKKQRWHFGLICCWSPRAARKQHKLLFKSLDMLSAGNPLQYCCLMKMKCKDFCFNKKSFWCN